MSDLVKPQNELQKEESMENYKQLCVLQGVVVGEADIESFEKFFLDDMGVRVKYLTEVKTNPDKDEDGNDVSDTGGRNDVLFHVHDEDAMKFAIPRMQMGVRWWEDVVKYNNNSHLYSKEILDAYPPQW